MHNYSVSFVLRFVTTIARLLSRNIDAT